MANLIQRFFKSKSCFNQIQRLAPSLITHQKKPPYIESDPVSIVNPVITISGNESDQSTRFYPSFSMGYFMNPSLIQFPDLGGTVSLEEEKDEKEIVIYADSVKKKRKKKMNKHKYRKLRKKLGRKS
ncbi:hypothetical protein AALP_AA8G155600 [Arabis alpina]|uniref:Small ribosomal subunit protein mS38 n=1 Tax=Arabis alpina TaxID=50452 RepID=A0A087G7A6_ARAAL|nr:hypothetical protein AALP_AA8G155600 [Arabis alpina]